MARQDSSETRTVRKIIPHNRDYAADRSGNIWSRRVCRKNPQGVWIRLNPSVGARGYLLVNLYSEVQPPKSYRVHRLILETFVGPCPVGMEGRHLDGNKQNNHLTNLAWGTPKENGKDRILHGTSLRGERSPHAKLTDQQRNQLIEEWENSLNYKGRLRDTAANYSVSEGAIRKILKKASAKRTT